MTKETKIIIQIFIFSLAVVGAMISFNKSMKKNMENYSEIEIQKSEIEQLQNEVEKIKVKIYKMEAGKWED